MGTYTCTVCGYSYTVEIAALVAPSDDSTTSGGSSSADSSSTATTTPTSAAVEGTIPLVTGTKFKSRTTSSITITWIKADGITSYAIYQYNYSTDDYELIDTVGDVTQYKVTGLKAGTKYKFKVATIKDGVIGRRGTCYVKTVTKPKKVTVKSVKASSKAFTVK
ncbi:MAG: fibronectin type III domain-containing protein [Clostridiales bacterium]|nr:fibronectin type III domain-containing protein [Clostridiales bacterium]